MAKIADGVLHTFTTGEKIDADQAPSGGALNPIFEIIREAVNNTDGRVDQLVQALVGVDANRGVFQTKVEVFTATEGQTAFTLTKGTYTVGGDRLQVYVEGVIQTVEGDNFTETSSTVFTLSQGIPAGTSVIAVWVEGLLISAEVAVHGSRHEEGGADELDVLKLKNGDQIRNLSLLSPNGVDDTAAITNALAITGKVQLLPGTFICTKLTIGANKVLRGSGVGLTTIKLKDNTNTTLLNLRDAHDSLVTDLTLDGNKANNTIDTTDSILLVDTLDPGAGVFQDLNVFSYRLTVDRVVIRNAKNNGLSTLDDGVSGVYNWVYLINNINIEHCDGIGFVDTTTDNIYSNFYITDCKKANMMLSVGNCKYCNFKLDWGGETRTSTFSETDGANLIMTDCANVQFINLDCQSAWYIGAKLFRCRDSIINGSFDTNGMSNPQNVFNDYGLGISFIDCHNITGNVLFNNIPGDVRQFMDCIIDEKSYSISLNTENVDDTRIENRGSDCVVSSISRLKRIADIGSNFVKAFATSTARADGFAKAVTTGLVPENMLMWLDGGDFTNSPNTTTWTDKSGNGKNGAASGFAYTSSSGSDGSGGVVFDKVDDIVTVPQLLVNTGSYTISIKVKFLDLTNADGYQILRQGSGAGRILIGLLPSEEVFVQSYFGGSYDYLTESGYTVNTTSPVHITVTVDRSKNQKIYINGVLKGSTDISAASAVPWEVDTFKLDVDAFYYTKSNMVVYDTVVYDKVLSEKDVLQNYNAL